MRSDARYRFGRRIMNCLRHNPSILESMLGYLAKELYSLGIIPLLSAENGFRDLITTLLSTFSIEKSLKDLNIFYNLGTIQNTFIRVVHAPQSNQIR